MKKRLNMATRGFGAEPGAPDAVALAAWIAGHRGITADLITYLLDQSLGPQVSAGIALPCAGGKFYKKRIIESIIGVVEGKTTGEISLNDQGIVEDAAGIIVQKKSAWFALPSPRVLGISDTYYHDDSEWNDAITETYRVLMRSMRDTGINGHVLICDTLHEPEMLSLINQKVFFFLLKPDRKSLACLLEHQPLVAVSKDQLSTVFDLSGEYDIRKIIIVDPDQESIMRVLSHFDPDQVIAGGYCTTRCNDYWESLAESAVYTKR
jgi:hypothetical protein